MILLSPKAEKVVGRQKKLVSTRCNQAGSSNKVKYNIHIIYVGLLVMCSQVRYGICIDYRGGNVYLLFGFYCLVVNNCVYA